MADEILNRKAKWIVAEKMKIKIGEGVKEGSIEIFPDRYLVLAIMDNNNKRKIVTKDKELAYEVLAELARRF